MKRAFYVTVALCLVAMVPVLSGYTQYTAGDGISKLVDIAVTYWSGPEPRTVSAGQTLFSNVQDFAADADDGGGTHTYHVAGVNVDGARGALITLSWGHFEGTLDWEHVFSNVAGDTSVVTTPAWTTQLTDATCFDSSSTGGWTILLMPPNGGFLQGYYHPRLSDGTSEANMDGLNATIEVLY